MTKIEIDKDEPLQPGDVVELHFETPGPDWLKATEVAIVERAVGRREEFEIIRSDYWQPGKVIIAVRVKKTNPVVVTVALVCAAIALPAIAFGWMFIKAEKVVGSPGGQAISIGLLVIAGLAATTLLKG